MIGAAAFAICFIAVWAIAAVVFPLLIRSVRAAAGAAARWSVSLTAVRSRFAVGRWLAIYWSVLLMVLAGAFLALWAGDAFFDIAESIRTRSSIGQRIDHAAYDWLRSHRDATDDRFFVGATMAGSPVGMSIVVIVAAALLVREGRYRWAAYLVGTAAGGAALDQLLKVHFVRARPDLTLAVLTARGYSFPSGHAMGSTVVFAALAYLGMRGLRSWTAKSAAIAFCFTAILAIAFSRIYLGVHWITDVAAGIAAGMVWVAATTTAYETVRRLRLIRVRAARGYAETPSD